MFRRVGTFAVAYRASGLTHRRACATAGDTTASAAASVNKSKYDAVAKELEENQKLIAKLTSDSLYSAAACENLRKESLEAKKTAELQAIESFAKDMLEVCDALQVVTRLVDEYLQKNTPAPPSHVSVLAGIKLTEDVALKTMKRYGVSKICAEIGQLFDDKREEKLYTVPSTAELKNGCVAEVVKSGYLLNGSILRKAQVAVSEDP